MKAIKYIFLVLIIFSFQSCVLGERGKGSILKEERVLNHSFKGIKASSGLKIHLIPGTEEKVVVEAEENLQSLIKTEVHNRVLQISTTKNILNSRNVYVTYISLDQLIATSGAEIISDELLKSEKLTLDAKSGAEIRLEILSKKAVIHASSGGDLYLKGKVIDLSAKAVSGADIRARELRSKKCSADAASGGSIVVNVEESLMAHAKSGGSIRYYGNPKESMIKNTSSGSIKGN